MRRNGKAALNAGFMTEPVSRGTHRQCEQTFAKT
jgi:hypothetical protein